MGLKLLVTKPRLIFAGTPPFAATQLAALIAADLKPLCVLTQPDRPAGRGRQIQSSAVKVLALEHNIPVLQPVQLKDTDILNELKALAADLMIVCAYGLILPKRILAVPKYGCWNIHASLLPKFRGAAPIQYALWKEESTTGVTLMQMDAGMDTGDMLMTRQIPIAPDDTSETLHERLSVLGAGLLIEGLEDIPGTCQKAIVQDNDAATYAPKILKQDGQINFAQTAHQVCRQIRAFIPWPIAHFKIEDAPVRVLKASVVPNSPSTPSGTIVQVDKTGLTVACAKDCVRIEQIQLPGKKPVSFSDFYNSRPDFFETGNLL